MEITQEHYLGKRRGGTPPRLPVKTASGIKEIRLGVVSLRRLAARLREFETQEEEDLGTVQDEKTANRYATQQRNNPETTYDPSSTKGSKIIDPKFSILSRTTEAKAQAKTDAQAQAQAQANSEP